MIIIAIILIVIAGIYIGTKKKAPEEQSYTTETVSVKIGDLQTNEIVHQELSPEQISRITAFQEILKEVNPTSLEKTLDNFKRDAHPDNEIAIWEHITRVYQTILAENQDLGLDGKIEVYNLLLCRSMMSKEEVLDKIDLNVFSPEKAGEFIDYFEQ